MSNSSVATLSEILAGEALMGDRSRYSHQKAEADWYGAIRGLNEFLELNPPRYPKTSSTKDNQPISDIPPPYSRRGYVISGPSPVLINPRLAGDFTTLILTYESQFGSVGSVWGKKRGFRLLPPSHNRDIPVCAEKINQLPFQSAFPLSGDDPIMGERFCLVLTAEFSLVMVLGVNPAKDPAFLFSFDPDLVKRSLLLLRQRMVKQSSTVPSHAHHCITQLDAITSQFPPVAPHYQTVMQFSRFLLLHQALPCDRPTQPKTNPSETVVVPQSPENLLKVGSSVGTDHSIRQSQAELLQAIAHEVRTPLTTIITLTRLLLKRPNFDPDVVRKCLESIDRECSTQIDRFNLIFRAVELEMSPNPPQSREIPAPAGVELTTMSLADVFQNGLPRWQKQASGRNHTLEVVLPKQLPSVVSDPTLLDQMLTGVIENFTRSLPSGSHIKVGVRIAGQLLKLQLESHCHNDTHSPFAVAPKSPLKSIGPVLMVQPETGSLSLNINVTKNLFQALGGKLVVRQRPQQGKVMTIFLPVQVR